MSLDGKLYKVNLTTNAYTLVGAIGTDNDTTFINHGKYTIILKSDATPYYYDGTTLAQVTDGVQIETGEKPTIGVAFS